MARKFWFVKYGIEAGDGESGPRCVDYTTVVEAQTKDAVRTYMKHAMDSDFIGIGLIRPATKQEIEDYLNELDAERAADELSLAYTGQWW